MRRTYISTDYTYTPTSGTFNMIEHKSVFSSKMMDIEDLIEIKSSQIIYYQQTSTEQINLDAELLITPITYSPIQSKFDNQTIAIDNNQGSYDKDNLTKWIINVNIKEILIQYIFANIKKERTFEGILSNKTKSNSIELAIRQYIIDNLLSRYKLTDIRLYLNYNSLNNISNLRYKTNWNYNIATDENLNRKMNVEYSLNKEKATISFRQEKNSKEYSFDYYFDIIFEKD